MLLMSQGRCTFSALGAASAWRSGDSGPARPGRSAGNAPQPFGRALWSRRGAEDDGEYARSAKRYRQALARDPTYLQSRVMSLGTWTERRSVFAFARCGCREPAFLRQGDARARSSSGEQRKVMVAGESIPSRDRTFAVPLAAIPRDPRRHRSMGRNAAGAFRLLVVNWSQR
jgi:hypothetical protein